MVGCGDGGSGRVELFMVVFWDVYGGEVANTWFYLYGTQVEALGFITVTHIPAFLLDDNTRPSENKRIQ